MNIIIKSKTFICKLCLYVTPFESVFPFYENRFRIFLSDLLKRKVKNLSVISVFEQFDTGKMTESSDLSSTAMNAVQEEMRLVRQTIADMGKAMKEMRENQT